MSGHKSLGEQSLVRDIDKDRSINLSVLALSARGRCGGCLIMLPLFPLDSAPAQFGLLPFRLQHGMPLADLRALLNAQCARGQLPTAA